MSGLAGWRAQRAKLGQVRSIRKLGRRERSEQGLTADGGSQTPPCQAERERSEAVGLTIASAARRRRPTTRLATLHRLQTAYVAPRRSRVR